VTVGLLEQVGVLLDLQRQRCVLLHEALQSLGVLSVWLAISEAIASARLAASRRAAA
jgi:hypothetical protein